MVTDARVYFQPLHDVGGDSPVRSHPLAAVAAVVRRRSSLRPLGAALSSAQELLFRGRSFAIQHACPTPLVCHDASAAQTLRHMTVYCPVLTLMPMLACLSTASGCRQVCRRASLPNLRQAAHRHMCIT